MRGDGTLFGKGVRNIYVSHTRLKDDVFLFARGKKDDEDIRPAIIHPDADYETKFPEFFKVQASVFKRRFSANSRYYG